LYNRIKHGQKNIYLVAAKHNSACTVLTWHGHVHTPVHTSTGECPLSVYDDCRRWRWRGDEWLCSIQTSTVIVLYCAEVQIVHDFVDVGEIVMFAADEKLI